ncbi:MAG: hypothetical protein A3F10_00505 [Coxiella sp. RIFCSPHIGHO2_12_FULL_42_15]|nr:MAG: hypothetical protein A3F10_00505 [Coxiella sp. RIFCSPHIGHO2_12_FULL_42_15]
MSKTSDTSREAELPFTPPSTWDQTEGALGFFSEASNVGIIIQMAGRWIPPLLTAFSGLFSTIAAISDPLIYFFKALIRALRIIGRHCFNVKFEAEKNGTHPWQTYGDIFSLVMFSLSIPLFLGIAGPVGVTLAWIFGLSGLSVVGYFDYSHQERLAKQKYLSVQKDSMVSSEEKHVIRCEYIAKRNSSYLFKGLLLGLFLLLICGSATAFAPPVIVPILIVISKMASVYLGGIAVARFTNWWCPHLFNSHRVSLENSSERECLLGMSQ